MKYLISIAIGPVQGFIATARRSRDLWFGSWMLSELSKAAAHAIVSKYKLENLIFPSPDDPNDLVAAKRFNKDSDFIVANKIVAIVDDPETAARDADQAVRTRLQELFQNAFSNLEKDPYLNRVIPDKQLTYFQIAEKQVNDLPEFYWAAYPLSEPQDSRQYKNVRKMGDALLGARKATRNFEQSQWGNNSPKSSLDGERESVLPKDARKGKSLLKLREEYGLRSEDEQLCGVSLLKRLGQRGEDDSFFSTSHVAALPFIQQIKGEKAIKEYIGKLKSLGLKESELGNVPRHPNAKLNHAFCRELIIKGNPEQRSYDGHLLFEGRLKDFFDKDKDKAQLEDAVKALHAFYRDSFGKLKEPLPYYAVLAADGDRMGETIDNQSDQASHRRLSKCLSRFAGSVREIVEVNHQGWVVYAGGDDVLAFVPLHRLVECARALAMTFAQTFKNEFPNLGDKSPTLSIGIGIAHHLDPLSDALNLARNAEKAAKSIDGKDALALIVSKRSGPETPVKGKWGEIDERLQRFTYLHCADAIPDGAAYDLRTMARDLKHLAHTDAIKLEAKRILRRKRAKNEDLAEGIVEELCGSLSSNYGAEQMAEEMIVARLLAQAAEQAGDPLDKLPGSRQPQKKEVVKQ